MARLRKQVALPTKAVSGPVIVAPPGTYGKREYRDITCSPFSPANQRDEVAAAILDVLTRNTGKEVLNTVIDAELVLRGLPVKRKAEAIKALRNVGFAISSHKHREYSYYVLVGTPAEFEEHRRTVVREMYSRQVSVCRELSGAVVQMPSDAGLADSLRYAQQAAISLGTDPAVGKNIQQVVGDLAVLVP